MLFAQVMDAEEDPGLLGQGQMTVLLSATAVARVPAFSHNHPPALTSTGVTTRATWPLHTQAGVFLDRKAALRTHVLHTGWTHACPLLEGNATSIIQDCSLHTRAGKLCFQDKVAASASLLKDLSKCRGRAEDCLPTVRTTAPITALKGLSNLLKVIQLVTQAYTMPKPVLAPAFTAMDSAAGREKISITQLGIRM